MISMVSVRMKRYEVYAGYHQFYVADAVIEPNAPEDWNDTHVQQRHNTLKHITALCVEGDITARIISCGPHEPRPLIEDAADFEVLTCIDVPSGKIGAYGWPWEQKDIYDVTPGKCRIRFTGYRTERAADEEDYYLVELSQLEQPSARALRVAGDGSEL